MKQAFNINTFIFGRTKAEKKLQVLDSLNGAELRKATNDTILRIYKECKGNNDRFWIKNDRRVGNDWNSTIEFIYEYRGEACICLYVQNSSTDSSECVGYNEFKCGSEYRGYCSSIRTSFRYSADAVANIIRCILKEFVYYKYIEREEREKKELIETISNFKIINPVVNYYYNEWRLKYVSNPYSRYTSNDEIIKDKGYYAAKEGLMNYINEHYKELVGKSEEELIAHYKVVFLEEFKKFKQTFDVNEYRKSITFWF